jgi:hypothetical protein
MIHDRIAIRTDARFALELGRGQRGVVGVREARVEEEGLLRPGLTLDKIDRRLGDVALHLPAVLQRIGPHLLEVSVRLGSMPGVRWPSHLSFRNVGVRSARTNGRFLLKRGHVVRENLARCVS